MERVEESESTRTMGLRGEMGSISKKEVSNPFRVKKI
jgi:hypothetical protein